MVIDMKEILRFWIKINSKHSLLTRFLSKKRFECNYWRHVSSTFITQNALKEKSFKEDDIFTTKEKLDLKEDSNLIDGINKNKLEDENLLPNQKNNKLPMKIRLKQAVKDYGSTVIVFHTLISLSSLGLAYLAVSSGIDVVWVLTKLGASESLIASSLAKGASTFVMAYALHKVFAPVRILCTLTCVPIIVHKLRKIGFLRTPKTK